MNFAKIPNCSYSPEEVWTGRTNRREGLSYCPRVLPKRFSRDATLQAHLRSLRTKRCALVFSIFSGWKVRRLKGRMASTVHIKASALIDHNKSMQLKNGTEIQGRFTKGIKAKGRPDHKNHNHHNKSVYYFKPHMFKEGA